MADGKWIRFEQFEQCKRSKRKTAVYFVVNKTYNACLGEVRWYSPWRQYVFAPKINTLYARSCLAEIAQFVESLMKARGHGR